METTYEEPNPLNVGAFVSTGIDGKLYVVFPDAHALELYMDRDPHKRYAGKPICCFGQYENAICIS